jgi:uncharacterized protein YjbI with pentapeptide repeats
MANLIGVNLRMANLNGTVFAFVDLSATKGLDECNHSGPSILDHSTLQRSGRLPLAFLRGCGLADRLIERGPSTCLPQVQQKYLLSTSLQHAFAAPYFAARCGRPNQI